MPGFRSAARLKGTRCLPFFTCYRRRANARRYQAGQIASILFVMRIVALASLISLMTAGVFPALAQDAAAAKAPPRFVSVIGTVDKVDAAEKVFGVKTDKGEATTVKFDEKTAFQRLPVGETDVKKATKINSGDVGAGDRILARVHTEDPTGQPALTFYVTKQADIAQRQQKTREEWQTQSVAGAVKAIDAAAKQITISVRGAAGPPRDVTLDAAGNVDYMRFSADTLKYEPSALAAIQVGDQVRVLGQKNADVTEIKLEAAISGAFKTVPVQIKSIDAGAGTITATDLASKKPILISVKPETTMKKLDDQTALLMARRLNPSFQGGRGGRGGGGDAAPVAAGPDGAAPGGGRGGRGGRGGAAADPSRLLEQQPSIQLADLKPGDPIVVTGPAVNDMSKLTAMTLIAGVEPILRAAPQNGPDPLGGNWNFGDVAPPQ